jgi:pimeloyl-ACP methyl ester carboxylesterase
LVTADESGDLERVSELEGRIWVEEPYRGPDRVEPGVRDLVGEMNLIALRNEASGLGDELSLEPPAVGRLVEIQVPTLIIVGDLDQPETPGACRRFRAEHPRYPKVVMPRTAHLPNMESSDEFNRIVLEFLDGLRV